MKKLFLVFLLLIASSVFAQEYVHHGFSVKCAKCVELAKKHPSIDLQVAWRTFEYKSENGKTYALYKCQGGHQYWAEIR